jgi:cobalt-zinc-cadmium efflux system outer membrane protein
MLDQARQESVVAQAALVAYWDGQQNGISVVAEAEPDLGDLMRRVASLEESVDSTRTVAVLHRQSEVALAERALSIAESRPGVTLSGGIKRLEEPNSNSFLLGISLPLPLFNHNQGERDGFTAQLRSLDYQIERERIMATAEINAQSVRLRQLVSRHDSLDSLLLPTAEAAYETLQRTYAAGRLPYTQLLEARRLLYGLSYEHNDLLLAIHEQIIRLESLIGLPLRIDREN